MARRRRPKRVLRHVPISVGDVLLASATLKPRDDKTRAMVLGLLGFEVAPDVAAPTPVGPWKPVADTSVAPPAPPPPPAATPPRVTTAMSRMEGAAAASTWIGKRTFAVPAWAQADRQPFTPIAGNAQSLPPPPLFERPRVRALLAATLGTFRDGPQIDVDRAVRVVSSGAQLERIPYSPVSTLRRGAQVLVDRGTPMDPYQEDVEHVLADLRKLLGPGHVQVLEFSHCPSRGVRSPTGKRRERWRSPGRGVPVLVVSDVGLGTPVEDDDFATLGEWLEFAKLVRESECPIAALLPFPPERWPPALTRAIAFVFWSERTTARQVVKAMRESRRLTSGVR